MPDLSFLQTIDLLECVIQYNLYGQPESYYNLTVAIIDLVYEMLKNDVFQHFID